MKHHSPKYHDYVLSATEYNQWRRDAAVMRPIIKRMAQRQGEDEGATVVNLVNADGEHLDTVSP